MIGAAVALLIAATPLAPDDLAGAVGAVVGELELGERPLPREEALALAVRAATDGPESAEVVRIVRGLLLSAMGPASPIAVEADGDLTAMDEAARRAGAEWLLLATVERWGPAQLVLRAELRGVDRGLWAPVPAATATPIERFASQRIGVGPKVEPLLAPPTKITPGRPRRVHTVNGPVLALAACDLDDRAGEEIIALGLDELLVLTEARGRLKVLARLGLSSLPVAPMPVRDAIGSTVCDGDALAFGHSGLARGHRARLTQGDLQVVATIEGVPLAKVGEQLVLGRADAGTNRWRVGDDLFVLDVVASDTNLIAVTPTYDLVQLDADLTKRRTLGTSGVAPAWIETDGTGLLVTTSSAAGATDELRLLGPRPQAVAIAGPVHASTAAAWRDGAARDLIVAVRRKNRTELQAIALEAAR